MPDIAAKAVRESIPVVSESVVAQMYAAQRDRWQSYAESGRQKSVRDVGYHLSYLAEALDADDPTLFSEYLAWAKALFAGLNFSEDMLPNTLQTISEVLSEAVAADVRPAVLDMLNVGIQSLAQAPTVPPSFLEGDDVLDELARAYLDALLMGDRRRASQMVLGAVQGGASVKSIYARVFERSQREIGRLWQMNRISVAQEHFCTAATQMIMSQLYPYIFTGERKGRRMVTACVGGELHEIGARMVADFFEMEGWDTYFLGANTPQPSIVQAVQEHKADILAISATMTFHVGHVSELIRALRQSNANARILVGGYPFNLSERLWQTVGADGYARDATSALLEAERLLAQ